MKITVKKEGELLDYLYNNLDMPKKRIKQYLTHGSIFVNETKTTIDIRIIGHVKSTTPWIVLLNGPNTKSLLFFI